MTHTVIKGETLSSIGAKYGKSYQELAQINRIQSPYTINVNQVVKIMDEPPSNPEVIIRVVNPFYWAIMGLECKVTYNGATHTLFTDGDGYLPSITTQNKQEKIIIEVKRWVGGHKKIAEVTSGSEPKVVPVISPWYTIIELLQLDRPNQKKQNASSRTTPSDSNTRLPVGSSQATIENQIAKLSGNMLITKEMVKAVASGKEQDDNLMYYLNFYAQKYEVNTRLRIAHFLAQVGHESHFDISQENLNYSEKRMKKIFGCKKNGWVGDTCLATHKKRLKLWTDPSYYTQNPQNLANYVYAARMENGDEESGDGYKYRGRGIIQLTGKNNYRLFTEEHNKVDKNDKKDFVKNPELLLQKKYGIESAFFYWYSNHLNKKCRLNNVEEMTMAVNGGTNGLEERIQLFQKIISLQEKTS